MSFKEGKWYLMDFNLGKSCLPLQPDYRFGVQPMFVTAPHRRICCVKAHVGDSWSNITWPLLRISSKQEAAVSAATTMICFASRSQMPPRVVNGDQGKKCCIC